MNANGQVQDTSGQLWRCDDKRCVPKSSFCDEKADCLDESDEKICGKQIKHLSTEETIVLGIGIRSTERELGTEILSSQPVKESIQLFFLDEPDHNLITAI